MREVARLGRITIFLLSFPPFTHLPHHGKIRLLDPPTLIISRSLHGWRGNTNPPSSEPLLVVVLPSWCNQCYFHSFFSMELWPGYTTSIQALEEDVLLCADVSHKILRTDTVLDWLYQFKSKYRGNSFYEDAEKKLIGQIMITRLVIRVQQKRNFQLVPSGRPACCIQELSCPGQADRSFVVPWLYVCLIGWLAAT